MRPLVQRELADALGVRIDHLARDHRQVHGHAARHLRAGSISSARPAGTEAGGNASARTAVRALIRQFVAAEDPCQPLSDQRLADMLKEQGIDCARRTVAKYREALKIAPTAAQAALNVCHHGPHRLRPPARFGFIITDWQITSATSTRAGTWTTPSCSGWCPRRGCAFQSLGYREGHVDGAAIVVGDMLAQYKSEAFHGETLRVQMQPADFNRYGFDLVFRMTEATQQRGGGARQDRHRLHRPRHAPGHRHPGRRAGRQHPQADVTR